MFKSSLFSKNFAVFAIGSAILVSAGASFFILEGETSWPENAQSEIIAQMAANMRLHDCSAEMEVWRHSINQESEYLFFEENKICQQNYELAGWITSEAAITGIFRCDLEDRFAEYAFTVYRNAGNAFGRNNCQYIVKFDIDDQGIGRNFEVDAPNPLDPRTRYDNDNKVFETLPR